VAEHHAPLGHARQAQALDGVPGLDVGRVRAAWSTHCSGQHNMTEQLWPLLSLTEIDHTIFFRALADIARWLQDGRPKFTVARRFPLDRIADAHEYVESGQRIGQAVLDVG
jgi:NADPH:quinone reductase-like Zn-dependent oxidoreductase